MFLHQEADILFLHRLGGFIGEEYGLGPPYDVTVSTESGTVDTGCTASHQPSFSLRLLSQKPDRSVAIYPTDMFRLSFEPTHAELCAMPTGARGV